jgi:hypothetical protein
MVVVTKDAHDRKMAPELVRRLEASRDAKDELV